MIRWFQLWVFFFFFVIYIDLASTDKQIQAGWRNWRELPGVLRERRISARKKGKVYKVAVTNPTRR